jgi:hypothetical protein
MASEAGLGYELHPPASYTPGRKFGQPTVIFIHTTEGREGVSCAEDGAAYDARRTDGTSTHFFVDADSVVQCVPTSDEAHAARLHGNDVGIQVEVCGTAGQSSVQWHDPVSTATLEQLARLCAKLRHKYGANRFPLVHLTPARLRAGQNGFAGHADATKAWPEDAGTHSDPGPNFPWDELFGRIRDIEKASIIMSSIWDETFLVNASWAKRFGGTVGVSRVKYGDAVRLAAMAAKDAATAVADGGALKLELDQVLADVQDAPPPPAA